MEQVTAGDTVLAHLEGGTLKTPLVEQLRHWERESEGLLRPVGLPTFVRTEMARVFDLDAWKLSIREIPPDYPLLGYMFADMRQQAPQALLRDLHRAVRRFNFYYEPAEGTDWNQMASAWQSVLDARKPLERQDVRSLLPAMREEGQRLRAYRDEPWKAHKPDDAPRDKISFYSPDDG